MDRIAKAETFMAKDPASLLPFRKRIVRKRGDPRFTNHIINEINLTGPIYVPKFTNQRYVREDGKKTKPAVVLRLRKPSKKAES